MEMYKGMVYGVKVSEFGISEGRLDFLALTRIVGDMILNNDIRDKTMHDWEIATGEFDELVMSDYIISEQGYKFLKEHTNELVFYNWDLNLYIWAVTHNGTRWDYVLTDIYLEEYTL